MLQNNPLGDCREVLGEIFDRKSLSHDGDYSCYFSDLEDTALKVWDGKVTGAWGTLAGRQEWVRSLIRDNLSALTTYLNAFVYG